MHHIRFIALALFTLGLPAQAGAWDTPSYSEDDFCEEAASNPEILNEPMREALGHSTNWLGKIGGAFWGNTTILGNVVSVDDLYLCTSLETSMRLALISLGSPIESNISEQDIKDCETRSLTPGGNGSYYKLADCLLRLGRQRQHQLAREEGDVISELPIYNIPALCQVRMSEAVFLTQLAHNSCIEEESGAIGNLWSETLGSISSPPDILMDIVGDCEEKIGTEKGFKSYHRLRTCALEAVRAERRRRRQELMKEER